MNEGKRKIFHRLATIEEAIRVLDEEAVHLPGEEEVPVGSALWRVASRTHYSKVNLPPFDRAEMDGYALISSDTEGASDATPSRLRVIGRVDAGQTYHGEIERGSCVEIATGAPVPRGADAVVMVENTSKSGKVVEVYRPVTPGENIAHAGSDVEAGEAVLRKGTMIGVREVAILSAAGLASVRVYRKPRVGIISTGNELAEPGFELEPGKVYDANSRMLSAAVIEAGGEPAYFGLVPDDMDRVKGAVAQALESSDLVLISGGTSAGLGDVVYRALEEVCVPGIRIHGLQIKPGKPTVIAIHGGKAVIGLPGYPVSALMVFNQIVRPLISKVSKAKSSKDRALKGSLAQRVNGAKGRRWFLPVHMLGGSPARVYPILSSSGAVGTLSKADGYIVIPEDAEYLKEGDEVQVSLFGEFKDEGLVIMGSHCPALDQLLELLYEREGITSRMLNVGSLAGLSAVARGECDLAGVHLLDEESMAYNLPFVRKAGLPESCLVKGYKRMQGIALPKGNPKNVSGIEDLLRGDLIFANRNRGSGTRILTDRLLRELADKKGIDFRELVSRIKGYRTESKTHSSVAAAVSQGRADLGICIKSAADAYGLDFIPLAEEEYDFVISPKSLEKGPVRGFLECLRSEAFRDVIRSLPGYSGYQA